MRNTFLATFALASSMMITSVTYADYVDASCLEGCQRSCGAVCGGPGGIDKAECMRECRRDNEGCAPACTKPGDKPELPPASPSFHWIGPNPAFSCLLTSWFEPAGYGLNRQFIEARGRDGTFREKDHCYQFAEGKFIVGNTIGDVAGEFNDGLGMLIKLGAEFVRHLTLCVCDEFSWPADLAGNQKPTQSSEAVATVRKSTRASLDAPQDWASLPVPFGSSTLVDVNGDHMADLVSVQAHGIEVRTSAGNSFSAARLWASPFFSDRQPVMSADFADVTGDGRADAIVVNGDGIYVRPSNGTAFNPKAHLWTSTAFYGAKGTRFADVTGDGAADALAINDEGIYVLRSLGDHFASTPENWSDGPFFGDRTTLFADVNGDGKADALAVNTDGVYLLRQHVDGSSTVEAISASPFFGDLDTTASDMDGDGRADLVAIDRSGIFVRRSLGESGLGAGENWSGAFFGNRGTALADLDGDGASEALVVNE